MTCQHPRCATLAAVSGMAALGRIIHTNCQTMPVWNSSCDFLHDHFEAGFMVGINIVIVQHSLCMIPWVYHTETVSCNNCGVQWLWWCQTWPEWLQPQNDHAKKHSLSSTQAPLCSKQGLDLGPRCDTGQQYRCSCQIANTTMLTTVVVAYLFVCQSQAGFRASHGTLTSMITTTSAATVTNIILQT